MAFARAMIFAMDGPYTCSGDRLPNKTPKYLTQGFNIMPATSVGCCGRSLVLTTGNRFWIVEC